MTSRRSDLKSFYVPSESTLIPDLTSSVLRSWSSHLRWLPLTDRAWAPTEPDQDKHVNWFLKVCLGRPVLVSWTWGVNRSRGGPSRCRKSLENLEPVSFFVCVSTFQQSPGNVPILLRRSPCLIQILTGLKFSHLQLYGGVLPVFGVSGERSGFILRGARVVCEARTATSTDRTVVVRVVWLIDVTHTCVTQVMLLC